MARLICLTPVAQAVAAYATLRREAEACGAESDGRGRGQLMCDLAIQRITGQASAADVPVEVALVMTPETLLAGGSEPAVLIGTGPVPADWARELIRNRGDTAATWIRRLFTRPGATALAAMETRRRGFSPAQRRFIRLRDDGICRTPWCDAPIRHTDHVVPVVHDGPTVINNGQGYCEACNYAKQAAGWQARAHPDGTIETITPTRHRYQSRAPDPPAAA